MQFLFILAVFQDCSKKSCSLVFFFWKMEIQTGVTIGSREPNVIAKCVKKLDVIEVTDLQNPLAEELGSG